MILIHGLQLTFNNQNNVTQQPQKKSGYWVQSIFLQSLIICVKFIKQ